MPLTKVHFYSYSFNSFMSKKRKIEYIIFNKILFTSINYLYENSILTKEWNLKETSQIKDEIIFFCYFKNKKDGLFFICDAV